RLCWSAGLSQASRAASLSVKRRRARGLPLPPALYRSARRRCYLPDVRFSELSALSARHWRFVLLLVAATIVFGVFGITRLARPEDPTLEVNEVVAYTVYAGAGPADVEQLVSKPLDEAIKGVDHVRTVTSFALNSLSLIDVIMEDGADYAKV